MLALQLSRFFVDNHPAILHATKGRETTHSTEERVRAPSPTNRANINLCKAPVVMLQILSQYRLPQDLSKMKNSTRPRLRNPYLYNKQYQQGPILLTKK